MVDKLALEQVFLKLLQFYHLLSLQQSSTLIHAPITDTIQSMQLTASWNNTFKNYNIQSTIHKQLEYHLCAVDTEHAYNGLQPTHKAI